MLPAASPAVSSSVKAVLRKGNPDLAPDRPSDPPAVPGRLLNEVQVIIHVLSVNPEIDPTSRP
jgi:hypothetical protein